MFANPIAGAILSSTGAIPVRRNPNNGYSPPTTKTKPNPQAPSRSSLFQETSKVLASNQVVGVFPEGTSYTQSSIIQVMPGAAWAAVEYAQYIHDHNDAGDPLSQNINGQGKQTNGGLKIVPVAIVYTDKSQYQSRVSIILFSYVNSIY